MPQDPPGAPSGATRWLAGLGLLSGAALTVAPFLPWVEVQTRDAERVGRALAERARAEAGSPGSAGYLELGERLVQRGSLTGLDLTLWARSARARLGGVPEVALRPDPADETTRRGWALLAGVVLGLPLAALALCAYLVRHQLRRWRSPALILAGVLALLALGLGVGLTWIGRSLDGAVTWGPGRDLLAGGGLALLTAALGSLRLGNAWRVLAGLALTVLSLGGLAWAYLVGSA